MNNISVEDLEKLRNLLIECHKNIIIEIEKCKEAFEFGREKKKSIM